MTGSIEESLKLERYKYVLEQKKGLNERTFKIVTIYQAIVLALAGAQFKIMAELADNKLDSALASDATWILFGIFVFISTTTVALLGGGLAAWMGYKRDEASIISYSIGNDDNMPFIKKIFRWYETYLILAIVAGVILYLIALFNCIFPIIISFP